MHITNIDKQYTHYLTDLYHYKEHLKLKYRYILYIVQLKDVLLPMDLKYAVSFSAACFRSNLYLAAIDARDWGDKDTTTNPLSVGDASCSKYKTDKILQPYSNIKRIFFFKCILLWVSNTKYNSDKNMFKIASEMPVPHSLGKYFFTTMRYRNSEIVQRLGYFHSSVTYIKVQIMFK